MRTVAIARTTTLAAAVLTVLAGFLAKGPANAAVQADQPAAATEPAATKPAVRRLVNQSAVGQLITVTAASRTTTYATFRVYQVTGVKRTEVFGPWTARVGYNGIAAPGTKREGDGRSPSGTYGFSFFFGVAPDPGVAFPYRHAYSYDYWDDDPASPRYNEWVDARTASPTEPGADAPRARLRLRRRDRLQHRPDAGLGQRHLPARRHGHRDRWLCLPAGERTPQGPPLAQTR